VFHPDLESYGDEVPHAHTHVLGRLTRYLEDTAFCFAFTAAFVFGAPRRSRASSSFGAWRHDLNQTREKLLDDIVATDLKSRCRRLKRFDKEPKHGRARRDGISRIACL
jgi:hypothetical protein